MSLLPVPFDDDSLDGYWNPSFNNLENEVDFGRDRILEIIMVIYHYLREKLGTMAAHGSSISKSVEYKNLLFLNNFLYHSTVLALQAKFSFYTTAPRHLPRRSSLAQVIERHSLMLSFRSNAMLYAPSLEGRLNHESVRNMLDRQFGSIFELSNQNENTEVNAVTQVLSAVYQNLMSYERGFNNQHSLVQSGISQYNDVSVQSRSSPKNESLNSSSHKNVGSLSAHASLTSLAEGELESYDHCSEYSAEQAKRDDEQPITSDDDVENNNDELRSKYSNEGEESICESIYLDREEQTPAPRLYSHALVPMSERRDAVLVMKVKERYSQLRRLAREQRRQYLNTKAEIRELEKQLDEHTIQQFYDSEDDDDDGLTNVSQAGASFSQSRHDHKKTNMASSSDLQKLSRYSSTLKSSVESQSSFDFYKGNETGFCKVCQHVHDMRWCPMLRNKICYNCGLRGHIKYICPAPERKARMFK